MSLISSFAENIELEGVSLNFHFFKHETITILVSYCS